MEVVRPPTVAVWLVEVVSTSWVGGKGSSASSVCDTNGNTNFVIGNNSSAICVVGKDDSTVCRAVHEKDR